MKLKTLLGVLLLCVSLSLFITACNPPDEQSSDEDMEKIEAKAEEDFQATMAAFRAEEDKEKKFEIIFDYLERYPDSDHSVGAVDYLANSYFVEFKDDIAGAVTFTEKSLAAIKHEGRKAGVSGVLLKLYGKSGDSDKLATLADELLAGDRPLTSKVDVTKAYAEAKDWPKVEEFATAVMSEMNADVLRAESGDKVLSDSEIERYINKTTNSMLQLVGQARSEQGNSDAALEAYNQAKNFTTYNLAGVAWGDLTRKIAKLQFEMEAYDDAMDTLAAEVVYLKNEEALEIYKKAYLAAGGNEEAFAGHLEEKKNEIAPDAPDFFAYDYEGSKVNYSDVKGKVTLLAFWFPT